MSEKKNPTHWFRGVFDNGIQVAHAWAETHQTWVDTTTRAPVEQVQTEGIRDKVDYLEIYRADGTVIHIKKDRLLHYEIGPWKELPEAVKAQVELAKARPSSRDVH